MASMNLPAIRRSLATKIETGCGLRAYAVVPDVPELPCVVVWPGEPYVDLHEAFAGTLGTKVVVRFTLRVMVTAAAGWRAAQDELDRLLSSGLTPDRDLVSTVEEAPRTLDGYAVDLICTQVRGVARESIEPDSAVAAYTADVDVEVHAYR